MIIIIPYLRIIVFQTHLSVGDRGGPGRDCMVDGFITTNVISTYHH